MERIALVRPLSGLVVYPEVAAKGGSDTRSLSGPGDVSFTVSPDWHHRLAEDGRPFFLKRGTLVVVERANKTIRQVGLVDDLSLSEDALDVSCGGFSMVAGQSGPWEGHQGYFASMDPVTLFRRVWEQVQTYKDAALGIRVTGATSSGSSVGDLGSDRWRRAEREFKRLKPDLDRWEGRLTARERIISQRQESMFRAAGLKRVGQLHRTEDGSNPPDDPGYKADSTLWVRDDAGIRGRAFRWRDGRWISQSQADEAVRDWRNYLGDVETAKAEVERLRYLVEPLQDRLDELEERGEAREEYGLYFWQNHDLNTVIEDLTALGPFEFREEAAWKGDALDLMLNVGAPKVGVRREELHLELGVNVHEQPVMEYGELYTGVALFGAGEGSETLSAQRDLNLDGVVRRVLVETDKDAHTKALTRAAANKLADQAKKDMGLGFTDLVIHHTNAVPEGSFDVGDEIPITGTLSDGTVLTRWMRVLEATHEWGSNKTSVEVEPV